MACLLSGCGLFAVKEQHDKFARYCRLYGTVRAEKEDGKKIIVVLLKYNGGDVTKTAKWSLFDHFVSDGSGKWFFATSPGNYLVSAFKDVNSDLIYQPDEPGSA